MKATAVAAVFLALLTSARAFAATPSPNDKRQNDGIWFVTDAGSAEGPCLLIMGRLGQSDFFAGLVKVETPAEIQYRRKNELVRFFPNELRLNLAIRELPCHVGLQTESPTMLKLDDVTSWRFEAYWKRNLQMRPAEHLTLQSLSLEKDPPVYVYAPHRRAIATTWYHEFTVSSLDVPLTDHLVIMIFTKTGERLARFSIRM